MNRSIFRFVYLVSVLLWVAGASYGCTTRVVPIPHSDTQMIDDGHGLLLGTHRLDQDGKIQLSALKWSSNMKWWIEEVTHGKRSLIVRLPLEGSFAVKLPAGSYRVTKIVFDSSRGKWHTVLPTTFQIRSRECTSLGTSELQVQVGFFAGSITRRVLNEQELVDDGPERIVGGEKCPTSTAQLESPIKRSVKLGLYEKRLERF
jgi:hypothetical protein